MNQIERSLPRLRGNTHVILDGTFEDHDSVNIELFKIDVTMRIHEDQLDIFPSAFALCLPFSTVYLHRVGGSFAVHFACQQRFYPFPHRLAFRRIEMNSHTRGSPGLRAYRGDPANRTRNRVLFAIGQF